MKLFLYLFAVVGIVGVFTLKGYNAMGCAYVCCMALFCIMALSVKAWAFCRKGDWVIEVNQDAKVFDKEE